MSRTVMIWKGARFHFFSREESRPHVHVTCADGQAKFWLEPEVGLAKNIGLANVQVNELARVVKEHQDELISAWHQHFG